MVGLGPIRSISWSCQALAPIYFIPTVLLNLHLQQVPNPYQLVARRQWLRVSCVENRNLTSAEKLATARTPTLNSSILVAYPPSQPRRMGNPLGSFPTQVGLRGGWRSAGPVKNIRQIWHLQTKKTKQNLSESDSENEAADFPRFIVIKSLEEVFLAKFSPFLIKKVISTRANPKNVKKTRNRNLLVKVDSWRQAENILKIKTFHTTKCRAYPHEKLNTSKDVIRSRELALATEDEIASALGKQGVTNIKRISIRKGEEQIQTNTYILTFNKPQTPKDVKIGYCLERVEQYVPAPLRCFKCQKFGHHRKACRGRQTCSKCGEKDLDHAEEDCLKKFDVQTANKIIRLTQELVLSTKKKKKLLRSNTREMFPFWKLGEL